MNESIKSPTDRFGPKNPLLPLVIQKQNTNTLINSEGTPKSISQAQKQSIKQRKKKFQSIIMQKKISVKQEPKSQFMKIYLVQKMINQFKNNLFINSYIIPKLKDITFLEKYHEQSKQSILLSRYIINPGWKIIIFWDCFGILINLLSLWLCPFIRCFQVQNNDLLDILVEIVMINQIIDQIVSLNRAFLQKGELVYDRKQIVIHYLKSQLLDDSINLLTWALFFLEINTSEYLNMFQIIFIYRIMKRKIDFLYQQFFLKNTLSTILDLLTLIVSLYFVAHTIACFWHLVGYQTSHSGASWLISYHVIDQSIWVRYNCSFYWATMTMATVGYGDIIVQNQSEMLVANIIMFISSVMFAYTINQIGYILQQLQISNNKFKKSLLIANNYMRKNNVDDEIQSRVRNFLHYSFNKEQTATSNNFQTVVDLLPNSLVVDLQTDISNKAISKIHILNKLFSKPLLQMTSPHLQFCSYSPKDEIFHQNDSDESLYFIESGKVELIECLSGQVLESIEKEFGQYQFFTGCSPKCTARSVGFSEIYKISRTKFLELLSTHRRDQEKFHSIRDSILFNHNFQCIDLQCPFCSGHSHLNIDCPIVQYKPDLEQRIKKSQFLDRNERCQNFRRWQRRQYNARNIMGEVQEIIKLMNEPDQNDSICSIKAISQKITQQKSISNKSELRRYESSKFSNQKQIQIDSLMNLDYIPQQQYFVKQITCNTHQLDEIDMKKSNNNNNNNNVSDFSNDSLFMLHEFINDLKFQQIDLDTMFSYMEYLPHNNVEQTIADHEKYIKKTYSSSLINAQNQASLYSFYYYVKSNTVKFRARNREL